MTAQSVCVCSNKHAKTAQCTAMLGIQKITEKCVGQHELVVFRFEMCSFEEKCNKQHNCQRTV